MQIYLKNLKIITVKYIYLIEGWEKQYMAGFYTICEFYSRVRGIAFCVLVLSALILRVTNKTMVILNQIMALVIV